MSIKAFWEQHVQPLVVEFDSNNFHEKELGSMDFSRAVSGGFFVFKPSSEIIVNGVTYLVRGSLSGVSIDAEVSLLEHIDAGEHERYLLIESKKYRIV